MKQSQTTFWSGYCFGEAEPGFVLLTDNPIISAGSYLLVVSFFA